MDTYAVDHSARLTLNFLIWGQRDVHNLRAFTMNGKQSTIIPGRNDLYQTSLRQK